MRGVTATACSGLTGVLGFAQVAVLRSFYFEMSNTASVRCRRPNDIGAVLLRSPLVDFLATVTDADGPLVAHEASEWGDAIGDAECLRAVSHPTPPTQTLKP